jgi:hypothetical protein
MVSLLDRPQGYADAGIAMESVLRGHPERDIPFCVKSWRLLNLSSLKEEVLFLEGDNHQARQEVVLGSSVFTNSIGIEILETHGLKEHTFGGIFEIRAYED